MENITGLTLGGTEWVPKFVTELNQENCIGCGRCFKVCPRDVFELIERVGSSDYDDDDYDDDDDDDFSDDSSMVMAIANNADCIGCQSCSRVCPKDCHSHEAAPIAA